MYRIGADFGQVTGSLTMSTTSVALGTPVPASTQAQTRATISLMQMSLNRPPPNGINAGITPFTYVFDAKTENALKQFLRSKGVPDQIVPGMWTRIMKASGLSEAGAKNWEAAIAFHKKWAAPKITTPIAKMPVAKTLVAKTPTTKVTTLGPAPLPGAAEECARQGGNFKLISGRWTCLKPVQPTLAPAPTPTPVGVALEEANALDLKCSEADLSELAWLLRLGQPSGSGRPSDGDSRAEVATDKLLADYWPRAKASRPSASD